MNILEALFILLAAFGLALGVAIVLTGILYLLHAALRLRRMQRYKAQDIADGLHKLNQFQKSD